VANSRKLVIVESPAKARTINKYLGKNFIVKASLGHIKDLPKRDLAVNVENGFRPEYVVIEGKKKLIQELKDAAKKVDSIYLAADPDREGEAICWHLQEELKPKKPAADGFIALVRLGIPSIPEESVALPSSTATSSPSMPRTTSSMRRRAKMATPL
jgi:DNA topoisomerase IA